MRRGFVVDTSSFVLENHHRLKWPLCRQRLEQAGLGEAIRGAVPLPLEATRGVHADAYVQAFVRGELSRKQMQRIGIPFSQMLLDRVLNVTGSTLEAAEIVLREPHPVGIAVLGGGAHHAHFDFGSGYCVFNDLSIAAARLTEMGKRVLILDLVTNALLSTVHFAYLLTLLTGCASWRWDSVHPAAAAR